MRTLATFLGVWVATLALSSAIIMGLHALVPTDIHGNDIQSIILSMSTQDSMLDIGYSVPIPTLVVMVFVSFVVSLRMMRHSRKHVSVGHVVGNTTHR